MAEQDNNGNNNRGNPKGNNNNASNRETKDVMKGIHDVFNEIAKSNQTAARSATKLNDALESLSRHGVEKLLENIKSQLKGTKLLSDEQIKAIKSLRDLSGALHKFEDGYEDIMTALNKRQKANLEALKLQGLEIGKANRAAQAQYLADLKKLNLTKEEADEIIKTTKALKDLTDNSLKATQGHDKLSKSLEYAGGKIKNSVLGFMDMEAGFKNMKEASSLLIKEWVALSRVGLQGAFISTQVSAMKLRLSFEEMSDVIGKSRASILQLGGGAAGIEQFTSMVQEASAGLSMLGPKEASKAAAMFINTISDLGVDVKDKNAYTKQMQTMTADFKEFSRDFGDTPEVFNEMIKVQSQDNVLRSKMIGLGRQQMGAVAAEIAARVKNEKMIGMSNEGLTDFNKKINDITNPEEFDPTKNASESISFGNSIAALRQQQPDNKELEAAVPLLQKFQQAHAQGDNTTKSELLKDPAFLKAAEAWSTAQDKENQQNAKSGFNRMIPNLFLGGSGAIGGLLRSQGMREAQHAKLVGQTPEDNINNMTPEQAKAFANTQDDVTLFGKTMKIATEVTQTWEAVMSNSLVKFTEGLAQVLLGFMSKLGIMGEAATAIAAAAAAITAAGSGATLASLLPAAAGMGLKAASLAAKGGGILGVIQGVLHSDNAGNPNESSDLWKQSKGTAGVNPGSGKGVSGPLKSDNKDLVDAGKAAGIDPRFLANMGNFESSGKSNAKNDKSSASGLFQFTDDTWASTLRKHGKEAGYDPRGMSDESIHNLKSDPRASAMMAAFYAKDNQSITGATDPGSMYLAHLLGPYGAKSVLTAPDSTPLTQLIKGKAYSGNAALFDSVKTVGGLKSWANNKMTGGMGADQAYTGVQKWDPSMANPSGVTNNGTTVNGSIQGGVVTPSTAGATGTGAVDSSPVTSAVGTTTVDTSPVANAVQDSGQVDSGSVTTQSATTSATLAGSSTPIDNQIIELSKQTDLLEAIARNTAKQPRSIVPEAQRNPNTRRDAATSN